MTAGCWQTTADPVAIQAIVTANGTSATQVVLMPKFKDQCIVLIYAKN
jgi:hypothetical protein